MKKIIMCLLCILAFIIGQNTVQAEQAYISLGAEIPGIRLYLKTPTVEKYKKMYQIINETTNELVYCVEPGVTLKDGYFEAYQSLDFFDIDLTSEQWNYARTIAYYGYGYQERTDIKWYAATQFIIWEYLLEGKGEIYFVDSNNNQTNTLSQEIAAIKKDVDAHMIVPSFLENATPIEVELGDTLTFTDTNNVLSGFHIDKYNLNYQVNGNELTVNFDTPGTQMLFFNKIPDIKNIPKIYYNPNSQTVINSGKIAYPAGSLEFHVDFPTLKLVKKSTEESLLSLKEAKYGLYYPDGSLYTELITDEEGIAYLEEIYPGEYYLQELEAPYGYKLNPEKIYFEVTDKDVTLEVEDELIKKEIVIEKYLEEIDGELELEKNASFDVLDYETGKLIRSFTTNEYGKFSLMLPYGKYLLKQTASTIGYNLSEDIIFTITLDSKDSSNLIIKNPQIKGSLLIEKKDSDTKELITEEAEFQIYNVDTKEYLKIDGIDIFKTKDGKLILENIPYGSYELIELTPPKNYQKTEERISFQITEEQEVITLEVLNKLQNGSLEIIKVDDETLKPIPGVLFGLYDQDKNLIEEYYTNEEGKITIENLLEGLYYIKELNTVDDYELLEGFMEVQIRNNILNSVLITNRLKVEVPITGTNEFFLSILFSSICLLLGAYLCNHD